jgi:glycosyltransferase involved in cell wall biosynthesis
MSPSTTLSVVLPNYNHSAYLRESLNAVFSQSYQPLEVIVIDDASTDNSLEILEGFTSQHAHLRVLKNAKNIGCVGTLARGLSEAKGTYITCPAADDVLLPGFFEKSLKLLIHNDQAGLCTTQSKIISTDGTPLGQVRSPNLLAQPGYVNSEKFLASLYTYGSWIMGNATVYNRRFLMEAGGYRSELRSFCDGFMQMVLGMRHGICFIPEPLAAWRKQAGTFSASIAADSVAAEDVINVATRLMGSEYRKEFPDDLIVRQRNRMLFSTRVSSMSAGCVKATEDFKLAHNGQGIVSTLLRGLYGYMASAKIFLGTIYYLLKYRMRDISNLVHHKVRG